MEFLQNTTNLVVWDTLHEDTGSATFNVRAEAEEKVRHPNTTIEISTRNTISRGLRGIDYDRL
jgi:hypothetical protein